MYVVVFVCCISLDSFLFFLFVCDVTEKYVVEYSCL